MSAPEHAEPIGESDTSIPLPDFECAGCGYVGNGSELLGVDDDDLNLWCPICGTMGWVWL